MDYREQGDAPFFREGTEVAKARRYRNTEGQLSLLAPEPGLRRKVMIAAVVIASVFIAGMIAGAVLGIFV
jgi:F0F1-type ATP synthase assembly protein I